MDHYHVYLEGYAEHSSGDVITKDGEVIGKWCCDENDICEFTPTGASAPAVAGAFLGLFCADIATWHEKNQ